ncbi:MAG: YcaO-like family protein [Candidatus Thiodiazotropha sp.]
MFSSLVRPYKEKTATDTIRGIKSILERVDLVPDEIYHANPYQEIFSSSIALPLEKGAFRTNGKGRNPEYSLASAYSEYMERMQNLMFATISRSMIKQLQSEFGFSYFPDEIHMDRHAVAALPKDVLDDFVRYSGQGRKEFLDAYFDRILANGQPGVVSVPFFDTRNKRIQFLPLNLLLITVGSNGMAGGNSLPEAIFQGLCELMERWSAALIYYGQLTPPTVPRNYLRHFPDEMKIIEAIESDNRYAVTIKDFSAGRDIPAIGVIISTIDGTRYRLNVGSDTSFQVALSRCLTEIYQGIQDTQQFDAALLIKPDSVPEYFLREDDQARNTRFHVFTQFTKDNSGLFPPSLFADTPSYPISSSAFTTRKSYVEEVQHLIKFIHSQGHNIYIRDVSFLGFPTVFVYAPDISAQGRKTAPVRLDEKGRFQVVNLDAIESMIFNFQHCSSNNLQLIAEHLSDFEDAAPLIQLFNIELSHSCEWQQLNVAFLLTQLYYSLGQYPQASDYFKRFCETRTQLEPYYRIVGYYLEGKTLGESETEIIDRIKRAAKDEAFETDLIERVVNDMSEPYLLQDFTALPKCPACDACQLSNGCLTRSKLNMARKVYRHMSDMPDQASLSWVNVEAN